MSIFDDIGGIINSAVQLLGNAITGAQQAGPSFIANSQSTIQHAIGAATSAVNAIGSAYNNVSQPVVQDIQSIVQGVVTNFSNGILTPALADIKSSINNLFGTASNIPNTIISYLAPSFANIVNGVDQVSTDIRSGLNSAVSEVGTNLNNVGTSLTNEISGVYNQLLGTFNNAQNSVLGTISGLGSSIAEQYNSLSQTVGQGIEAAASLITPVVSELTSAFVNIPATIEQVASQIVDSIKKTAGAPQPVFKGGDIDLSPVVSSIINILFS